MENQNVIPLWDGMSEQNEPPLRRPNLPQTTGNKTDNRRSQQMHQVKHAENDFSILTTSTLSVDAKEWFPSSHISNSISSAQNRLKRIKISENNIPPEGSHCDYETSEEQEIFDSSRLQEIIKSLTYDPGQFDNVIEMYMLILTPYFDNINVVSHAADTIFDTALQEANFRYNAARLCHLISCTCPLFSSRLHILCERELHGNRHPQGLTLFLAELYIQFDYESIYGLSLLNSINALIKSGKPDDIKCICQTLKLAGRSLEMYNKEALDGIFAKLNMSKPNLPISLLPLYESVVALRKNHWGYTNSQSVSFNHLVQEENGFVSTSPEDGFIFYGPDGKEITSEEREFLQASVEEEYLRDGSSDPDELFDPEPEMDEEIQAAFREFTKMNKR